MRMFTLAAAAAIATLAAAPLVAAPHAPLWIVNKQASRLGFAGAMNGQAFSGLFRRWDARIQFDPKALATSSVTAVIDTASVATGDSTRDEALPTTDWFAVSVFPRAVFSASQFKDLGGGRYLAIGTLLIRNVRRPATLPFQLAINGQQATMRGEMTIDRTSFGVGQGQFATGDTVATGVKVQISLSATRAR